MGYSTSTKSIKREYERLKTLDGMIKSFPSKTPKQDAYKMREAIYALGYHKSDYPELEVILVAHYRVHSITDAIVLTPTNKVVFLTPPVKPMMSALNALHLIRTKLDEEKILELVPFEDISRLREWNVSLKLGLNLEELSNGVRVTKELHET